MSEEQREVDDRTNPSKIALVESTFRKLSFLSKHFNIKDFDKVSFRRIDANALRIPAQEPGWDPLDGPGTSYNTIVLFALNGFKIGQVGVRNAYLKKWWWRNTIIIEERFEETIGEAIKRHRAAEDENAMEIYYIIGRLWKEPRHLIISQPPGTLSLSRWLAKEADAADKQIESESSIDWRKKSKIFGDRYHKD